MLRDDDEIRFDIVFSAVGGRTRRVFRIVGALVVTGLYVAALPATLDYVLFMRVESTSYLKIRLDWLYGSYLVFALAVVARQLWQLGQALRGRDPAPEPDAAPPPAQAPRP